MSKLHQAVEAFPGIHLRWRRISPDPPPVLANEAALVQRWVIATSVSRGSGLRGRGAEKGNSLTTRSLRRERYLPYSWQR